MGKKGGFNSQLESNSPNCVVGHLATTPRPLMCRSNNPNLGAPTLTEFLPQKVYEIMRNISICTQVYTLPFVPLLSQNFYHEFYSAKMMELQKKLHWL